MSMVMWLAGLVAFCAGFYFGVLVICLMVINRKER